MTMEWSPQQEAAIKDAIAWVNSNTDQQSMVFIRQRNIGLGRICAAAARIKIFIASMIGVAGESRFANAGKTSKISLLIWASDQTRIIRWIGSITKAITHLQIVDGRQGHSNR
jgi:hypothetical protein